MDPLYRQPIVQGLLGTLLFGSWRSLGLIVPFMPVLVWRLLDEEKLLQRDLPGYTEYMRRVRFRLVPFVW
jgi:protein-S-isoprenylcysteine O-methyltransferase Ste14